MQKSTSEHTAHSLKNIYHKLMDNLISLKRWKQAYLFYETLIVNRENIKNYDDIIKLFTEGISLSANLQMNEFRKNMTLFEEKYNRLLKVQHLKRTQPHLFNQDAIRDKMMEDNVSDTGSVVSGGSRSSSRSMKSSKSKMSSTSSKMSKKSKQKLSKRNIKEGSPIEEEFLIMILSELKIEDSIVEPIRDLIRVLYFINQITTATELQNILTDYLQNVNPVCTNLLSVPQQDFINNHPEIKDLFPNLNLNNININTNSTVSSTFSTKYFNTTSG
jgi:hypothetical protein